MFDKKPEVRRPLLRVGRPVPHFKGTIVTPDNKYADFDLNDLRRKYVVLVFFPLAFTFVCPTELIAVNSRIPDFHTRGAEVVAISIDSQYSLMQWKCVPTSEGGIDKVQYPLFSDLSHKVSKAYGVMHDEDEGEDTSIIAGSATPPMRGTFIIDRDGILKAYSINIASIGRNFDEALRLIDAVQHVEKHGEVCPAGWKKGEEGMKPTRDGVSDYLTSNADKL